MRKQTPPRIDRDRNASSLIPVGYEALVRRFDLRVLPHFTKSSIASKGGRKTIQGPWQNEEVYPKSRAPSDTVGDQLEFALKHEGINLEILSAVFPKVSADELTHHISRHKLGKYARRLWYLYELLTGNRLHQLKDLRQGNYVHLLDPARYYTGKGVPSRRHRVNDNLLGNRDFSPMVRKTAALVAWQDRKLDRASRKLIGKYPEEIIARAVTYLYTKETQSSYRIERESPGAKRTARFIGLLRLAGRSSYLNRKSLIKLQNLIVDPRFRETDYRSEQNYVGESLGLHRQVVHYISPRPMDVESLMSGLIACCERMRAEEVDPVLIAAVISFGFVFIHPFTDGNGRIHRFLIHHLLSRFGFTPEGVIFPVSAIILRNIKKYDALLESFSRPLLDLLEYNLDPDGVLTVESESAIHYRYNDMTLFCERLYEFLEETIVTELPAEFEFLQVYDRVRAALQEIVDLPDAKLDLLIRLLLQNRGRLAKAKRDRFFPMLRDAEILALELAIQELLRAPRVV